jgi:hypothetical protein
MRCCKSSDQRRKGAQRPILWNLPHAALEAWTAQLSKQTVFGPVLVAVVASIGLPQLHQLAVAPQALGGAVRALHRVELKPCMLHEGAP